MQYSHWSTLPLEQLMLLQLIETLPCNPGSQLTTPVLRRSSRTPKISKRLIQETFDETLLLLFNCSHLFLTFLFLRILFCCQVSTFLRKVICSNSHYVQRSSCARMFIKSVLLHQPSCASLVFLPPKHNSILLATGTCRCGGLRSLV